MVPKFKFQELSELFKEIERDYNDQRDDLEKQRIKIKELNTELDGFRLRMDEESNLIQDLNNGVRKVADELKRKPNGEEID